MKDSQNDISVFDIKDFKELQRITSKSLSFSSSSFYLFLGLPERSFEIFDIL